MNKLAEIQQRLIAPKGQFNSFGNYKYRSCEDILEAVKPLLGDSILLITDEVVAIMGGQGIVTKETTEKSGATTKYEFPDTRYYVKATAQFITGDITRSVSAYARESFDKKGMDAAQITGAASSYARKYALNGLFCIDDTKDPDSSAPPNDKKETKKAPDKAKTKEEKQTDLIAQAFFDYTTEHKESLAVGFMWDEAAFTRIIQEGRPETIKDFKNIVKNLPSKLVIKEIKK